MEGSGDEDDEATAAAADEIRIIQTVGNNSNRGEFMPSDEKF